MQPRPWFSEICWTELKENKQTNKTLSVSMRVYHGGGDLGVIERGVSPVTVFRSWKDCLGKRLRLALPGTRHWRLEEERSFPKVRKANYSIFLGSS